MAALFLRQVATWRSRQFSERLSTPPRNHLAKGAFHSTTLSQRRDQRSVSAWRAQKPSGSRRLSLPEDGRVVLAPGGHVAVQAVLGEVEHPAQEPFGEGRLPLHDLVPAARPAP